MGLNGGPYSVGRGDVGWEKEMEGEGMKGEWWQRKDGIRSFRVGFFASLQPMPLTSSSDTFSIMSKSLISTNPILCPSGGCGTPTAIMKGALYSSIRGKGSKSQPCLRWCTSASPRRVKCKFEFGSLGFCCNPRSSRTCAACQQPLCFSGLSTE